MTASVTEEARDRLTNNEINRFRRDGYLGPYPLCTPDEMAQTRADVERVLETSAPDHDQREHNRHLDSALIHDLATRPAITNRMACLHGEDLLLWRTNFFNKGPGAGEIPWHQDYAYWPLEPPIIISAWLAIDPSTARNGCLQVIPGSHRAPLPHIRADDGMLFKEMADPKFVEHDKAVKLEMQPGEFILFNERTLHHSEPNRSDRRRIGLAVRLVVPIVKVLDWDSPNHGLIQVRGTDPMGFNRVAAAPVAP